MKDPNLPSRRDPVSANLLLAWALMHTDKRVVEIGGGLGSTPFLHTLCADTDRPLVTLENNKDWWLRLQPWATGSHQFVLTSRFLKCELLREEWGVAFIDCHPPEWRVPLVKQMADLCDFIIVTDYNENFRPLDIYKWVGLPKFTYGYTDRSALPPTRIMSNRLPINIT